MSRLALSLIPFVLLSCDSKPATPDTAAPTDVAPAADSSDASADAPDDTSSAAWADLSMDDKKKRMMDVVVPTMTGHFQGVNAERYAEFNCVTCHGPGAKEGEFAMPSPSLPKLPPNGDFAKLFEAKPDVSKFMAEVVTPEMAKMLDVAPYDPKTNEGFGCYGCHQAEG